MGPSFLLFVSVERTAYVLRFRLLCRPCASVAVGFVCSACLGLTALPFLVGLSSLLFVFPVCLVHFLLCSLMLLLFSPSPSSFASLVSLASMISSRSRSSSSVTCLSYFLVLVDLVLLLRTRVVSRTPR